MSTPEPITVTFFSDYLAASKQEEACTLPVLASRIGETTANKKANLPWLKLARFGESRTERNSLRHDGNLIAISGLEADYDSGQMTLDEAAEILTKAGVQAMVYTSPSHTEAAPRWRVLCPLSAEYPPEARDKFMGRLNGLFQGVFASESWTWSQSYYFGSVENNPCHRVDTIDGTPIDEHDELDVIWTGKPNTGAGKATLNGEYRSGPLNEAELLAAIIKGNSYHEAAVRLIGRWARQGVPFMDARTRLIDAMEEVAPADRDARWHVRRADVDRCLEDIYGKQAKVKDQEEARSSNWSGQTKADFAYNPGAHTAEGPDAAKGPPQPPSDFDVAIYKVVTDFNRRFMMVNENGKAVIYQPITDPILRRRHYARMSPNDLRTLYMNQKVSVGLNEKGHTVQRTAAQVWLGHPERRQFIHGITFDPSGRTPEPGVLNLWEGFAVKPQPGDWSLIREHILSTICCGNQEHFDYFLGWLARMFQHPAEQGEVAVVMKGGEGTGKGTLAKALLHILGQHGFAISNSKHLVGNFNGHLRDAILLFSDEAFFAGDKSNVGTLKSIITEPYLTIEAKGVNAVQVPNFLHVLMASNEEWVVPASLEARRFFVLNVSDNHSKDYAYFSKIREQLEAGGYEAMLHDLLAYDLSYFNVRDVPQTEGLQQQRKLSLPTPEAWWQDCLERGYVFQSRLGLESTFRHWHPVISTDLLFASYIDFAKARHDRHPMSREGLGKFMRRMGATPSRPRRGLVGEHTTDESDSCGGSRRISKPLEGHNLQSYSPGPIHTARAAFTMATKLTIEWESMEITDEPD